MILSPDLLPPLPPGARRLLPGYDEADLARGRALVIARLLEDGDGADLAWLCAAVPEKDLAAWVGRHGRRKLSRRSRAFWQTVLGVPAGATTGKERGLWPL